MIEAFIGVVIVYTLISVVGFFLVEALHTIDKKEKDKRKRLTDK